MPTEQPATMGFQCGRCDARLTVKAFLAGKKINCPKCHKKVMVPLVDGGIAAPPDEVAILDDDTATPPPVKTGATAAVGIKIPATAPAAASKPEPVAPPPRPAVKPTPPPAAAPTPAAPAAAATGDPAKAATLEGELQQVRARMAERDREVERLRQEAAENRERLAQRDADAAKWKAEHQAAKASTAPNDAGQDAAAREAARQQAAELERARQQIAELERQVEETRKEAETARRAAAGVATDAVPVHDDGPNPDQLIADLQGSTLRRGMRISVLAHVLFLLLTSIGFIYWYVRGRPLPEPAETTEETTAEPATGTQAARAAAAQEAAMELDAPAAAAGRVDTPSPARDTAPAATADTPRPRSAIEEAIESLPEPGEVPRPSDVSLELD